MQKKKQNKDVTTLDEILDKKYGTRGKLKRDKWEQEFEVFRRVVLLKEATCRKK